MKARVMRTFDWHIYCRDFIPRLRILHMINIYSSNVFHRTYEREWISHDNYVIINVVIFFSCTNVKSEIVDSNAPRLNGGATIGYPKALISAFGFDCPKPGLRLCK